MKNSSINQSNDKGIDLNSLLHGFGVVNIITTYGFIRTAGNYLASKDDVYISNSQLLDYGLRNGDYVEYNAIPAKYTNNYSKHPSHQLYNVTSINGITELDMAKKRPHFSSLVPIYPIERYNLSLFNDNMIGRIIDIISPIGKGQRGLIVAPPKSGKTILLKNIANIISKGYKDVRMIILLIDERPEEVTDIQDSTDAEVIYSTFDKPSYEHISVAENTIDRAMRLVENGEDVVILLDSLTRLVRAYNLNTPTSGRILTGGLDSTSIYKPKIFFGSARNCRDSGSLTILATTLIDTGSKMDDVIYEEFKGTGNMEIHLDRNIANKRIYPAIDIYNSSTRREELLVDSNRLKLHNNLRRILLSKCNNNGNSNSNDNDSIIPIELLMKQLNKYKSNDDFFKKYMDEVNKYM